jgi:hypothetical protein
MLTTLSQLSPLHPHKIFSEELSLVRGSQMLSEIIGYKHGKLRKYPPSENTLSHESF